MYLIVGSGPAGVACAHALLERGAAVTMIDIGVECEPEKAAVVARMAAQAPEVWAAADMQMVSPPHRRTSDRRIPLKLAFGSDFAYSPPEHAQLQQDGTRCVMSSAMGGLSNVWGAAMLPFRPEELEGWPITVDDLAPHYQAVAKLVGLASSPDDPLASMFPQYGAMESLPPSSVQAKWLLNRMRSNIAALASRGIRAGPPRIALNAAKCRSCQLCLTGCVYGAIYCTTQTLDVLRGYAGFSYLRGMRALNCRDAGDSVEVHCNHLASGALRVLRGRRAFIGAGVLATARIIALSLGTARLSVDLRYHPYFMLPMLMTRSFAKVAEERLHTLAQAFVEITDPVVSRRTVHIQLYTYNPLFAERLAALGPLAGIARKLLLGRLVAAQGFLHSGEAEPIALDIHVEQANLHAKLSLRAGQRAGAVRVMRRASAKLMRNAHLTGLLPLTPAMEVGVPGDGNHVGGTFPMSQAPKGMQSDTRGRVAHLQSVHVIDASVFPSIPSTTITFTAMANARRIACAAVAGD